MLQLNLKFEGVCLLTNVSYKCQFSAGQRMNAFPTSNLTFTSVSEPQTANCQFLANSTDVIPRNLGEMLCLNLKNRIEVRIKS